MIDRRHFLIGAGTLADCIVSSAARSTFFPKGGRAVDFGLPWRQAGRDASMSTCKTASSTENDEVAEYDAKWRVLARA